MNCQRQRSFAVQREGWWLSLFGSFNRRQPDWRIWPLTCKTARRNLPQNWRTRTCFCFLNVLFTQNHVYPRNHWTLQKDDGFCYFLPSRILRLGDNFSLLWPWIPPNPSLWWRRETPASWEGKHLKETTFAAPKISQNSPWFREKTFKPRLVKPPPPFRWAFFAEFLSRWSGCEVRPFFCV